MKLIILLGLALPLLAQDLSPNEALERLKAGEYKAPFFSAALKGDAPTLQKTYEILENISKSKSFAKLSTQQGNELASMITGVLFQMERQDLKKTGPEEVKCFEHYIENPEIEVSLRQYALKNLTYSFPDRAKEALRKIAKREDPNEQLWAIRWDAKYEDLTDAKKLFYSSLQEKDPNKRKLAISSFQYWTDLEKFVQSHEKNSKEAKDLQKTIEGLLNSNDEEKYFGMKLVTHLPKKERAPYLQAAWENYLEPIKKPDWEPRAPLSKAYLHEAKSIVEDMDREDLDRFVPSILETLRKEPLSHPARDHLIKNLLDSNSPDGIRLAFERIEKPLEPHQERTPIQDMVGNLLARLENPPSEMDSQSRDRLKKLLMSKEPGLATARNAVRRLSSSSLRNILENEIVKESMDPSNSDPCSLRCRLVKHFSKNFETLELAIPEYYTEVSFDSFKMAVTAKTAEFLYQAAPACNQPEIKDRILKLFSSEIKPPPPEEKSTARKVGELQATLESVAPNEPAIERLKEFLKEIEKTEATLPSSAFIFAFAHLGQVLSLIKKDVPEASLDSFNRTEKSTQDWLTKNFSRYKTLPKTDMKGNSSQAAYHYSVAALGLGPNSISESALAPLKIAVAQSLARYQHPSGIDYQLPDSSEVTPLESSPFQDAEAVARSEIREGSARAIPVNLALYLKEREDPKRASNLLRALETYHTYLFDLFEGKGESRAHDYGDDALAPYFGPSTVSYALDSAKLLSEDTKLTSAERQSAAELGEKISARLQTLFSPNGLIAGQSTVYGSAEIYENAFAGLALHQACLLKQEREKKEAAPGSSHRKRTKASENETHRKK